MSKRTVMMWGSVAAAVVLIAAAVLLLRRPAAKPEAAAPTAGQPGVAAVAPEPVEVAPAGRVGAEAEPFAEPAGPTVRIRAEQVLARVNGVAITLSDLMVVGSGMVEQRMSPEVFEFLLNRAIERELTFQAARAAGVELSEEQQRKLEDVRAAVMAREGGDPAAVHLNIAGTLEERIAFEVREASAFLLQQSLLERAGVAPPFVSEELVEEYYARHRDEYPQLPDDPAQREPVWRQIDYEIRRTLAPVLQQQYQQRLREWLEELKAAARIEVLAP